MYKAIGKCDSCKFGNKTFNMAKFMKLKKTGFYNTCNMFIYRHIKLKNYTEAFCKIAGKIVFKLRLMFAGTLIVF